MKLIVFALNILTILVFAASSSQAVTITDDAGQLLTFSKAPQRVVSLVPAATEIITALGAASSLVGVTYHETPMPELAGKTLIGGAFTPQFGIINGLNPDLFIVAPRDFEAAQKGRSDHSYPILVFDDSVSLKESEQRMALLGNIFKRDDRVQSLITANHELMDTVAAKVDKIPAEKRRKIMRVFFSGQGLFTCGDDSFQAEMTRAAGGLTGRFGKGPLVPVTLEQWQAFSPDVIYTCGARQNGLEEFLQQEGWRDVPAAQHKILRFPCALTCQAATHTGYFVAWLASTIYTEEFCRTDNWVHPQEILTERVLSLDIPYVRKARILESRLFDFVHRTLLVDFTSPQTVISTSGSQRENVVTIGNSFSPVPTWSVYHKIGYKHSRDKLYQTLKLEPEQTELLFTGADMNNLVVKSSEYGDLKVTALVTAGVEGNAVRTSKDVGAWYEPGTINIIIMTNCQLTERAVTKAIVTVTEAKTAALWDMDIRSVQSGLHNPATGTGTDQVLVVAGEGRPITDASQHAKMGELIAAAVYPAVQEALLRQNAKLPQRDLLDRLGERGLSPNGLLAGVQLPDEYDRHEFQTAFEALLLDPHFQGFAEAALSLADAQSMGHLSNTAAFEQWCVQMAGQVAGKPVDSIKHILNSEHLPSALAQALNALATGLLAR